MERKLKKEVIKKTKPINIKNFEINGLPSGWKAEEAQFEEQRRINKLLDKFEKE